MSRFPIDEDLPEVRNVKYQRLPSLLIELGEMGFWNRIKAGEQVTDLYPAIWDAVTTAINIASSAGAVRYLLCAMKAMEDLAIFSSEYRQFEYLFAMNTHPDIVYLMKAARAAPAVDFLREMRVRTDRDYRELMAEPIKLAATEVLAAWQTALEETDAERWIDAIVDCRDVLADCLPALVGEASNDRCPKGRVLAAAARLAMTSHLYAKNTLDASAVIMTTGVLRTMQGDDLAVMARHGQLLLGASGFIRDMATDAVRDLMELDEKLKTAMKSAVTEVIGGQLIWFGTGVACGTSVTLFVVDPRPRLTKASLATLTERVNHIIREVFCGRMAGFLLGVTYMVKVVHGRTGEPYHVWEE